MKKTIAILTIILAFSLAGCMHSGEEISELQSEIEQHLLQIRNLTSENDNLKSAIFDLEEQVNHLKKTSDQAPVISQEEQQIRSLVLNIHQGWASIAESKNTNDLLKYFLPKYTTGTVRIDTEDIPLTRRSNDTNFKEYLEALLDVEDISLSFGQTDFLYTELRENLFATLYRTVVRVYKNNKLIHTSSVISLLAGENRDGWKVGKYSWVTFQYK